MEIITLVTSPYFWIALAVLFFLLELLIAGTFFPSVFGVGALFTAAFAPFIDEWLLLLGLFVGFSFLGIFFLKPLFEKWMGQEMLHPSNADAIIGKVGFITKEVQPHQKGYIKIDHEEWTAASETEESFVVGAKAVVTRIEGVTVYIASEVKGNNQV